MSTQVFPTLTGLAYPLDRTPIWDTIIQPNVSGKEVRLALQTFPRYQWDLVYSALRQGTVNNAAYTEMMTLMGFFNARQGSFDSFLFTDPDYNTATAQSIGLGDGTTTAFQLVQALNGTAEPVLAPNAVTTVYDNGTPVAAVGAPTNGTLSQTTAGALGATIYYVRSTWATATGETIAGSETNFSASANKVLNVAAPGSAPAAATGWNVYVSNTAGGGSGTETRQNGNTPIALGTPWVEPTSGLVAGVAYPTSDQSSAWNVNNWGTSTPGVINFAVAPASGHAITADFTFYYPCRFLDDKVPFSRWISNMYEVKKISIMSVKN